MVDGFCDVNVGGVQYVSYRQRRWGLFGGESGAQQPVVDDFDDFARSLAEAPSAGQHTWTHNSARVFSLHHGSTRRNARSIQRRVCEGSPAAKAGRFGWLPNRAADRRSGFCGRARQTNCRRAAK